MKLNDVANCFQTFLWQINRSFQTVFSIVLGGNQISLLLSDFQYLFQIQFHAASLLRLLYGSDIAQQANTTMIE